MPTVLCSAEGRDPRTYVLRGLRPFFITFLLSFLD